MDRQVHRGVEEDQGVDIVEHPDLLDDQVDRQQRRDRRQELRGQEEEHHVGPLLHRFDGEGVGRRHREQEHEERGHDARRDRVDEE